MSVFLARYLSRSSYRSARIVAPALSQRQIILKITQVRPELFRSDIEKPHYLAGEREGAELFLRYRSPDNVHYSDSVFYRTRQRHDSFLGHTTSRITSLIRSVIGVAKGAKDIADAKSHILKLLGD